MPARVAALLTLLLALALPTSGSFVEDATGGVVAYQFDGDNHHDAPDRCDESHPDWSVGFGNETDGLLVPPDDVADVFQVDIPADRVGTRTRIQLIEGRTGIELDLSALMPSCAGSLLDPANQPTPHPAPTPPAADQVQATIAEGAEPYFCASRWSFVLTGLSGPAPATIHAAWTDGTEQPTIPLRYQYRGYALYNASAAPVLLKGAWANLPADWSGSFVLASGACDAPDGGAVYGDPAIQVGDLIEFTPIRAGPHNILVTVSPIEPPSPPRSLTMSCHYCLGPVGDLVRQVSYFIRVEPLDATA